MDPFSTPPVDRVKIVVYSKSMVDPPVMMTLAKQLEAQRSRLDSEVLTATGEVFAAVEKTNITVLVLAFHEKAEFVEVLNLLARFEPRIQSGLLRTVILNGMDHPRVTELLQGRGMSEIVDMNVTIKTLNHKIKTALLLVTQTFQRLKNQNIRAGTVVGNELQSSPKENNKRNLIINNEIKWIPSVEHPADIWWIPTARNLRFVMGRWLVDLLGPGPSIGSWKETNEERQGERGWEWKIRIEGDTTFLPCPGRWVFYGKQPEFIWQKNTWSFVSKFPYLAFFAAGESEAEFVRLESVITGKLKIIENSEVARQLLPKVQGSLEANLKHPMSKAEVETQTGNFDLAAEDMSVEAGDYNQGDLSEDESPDNWNQHGSSIGVNFKAKDLRVDLTTPAQKWRNALTPDAVKGEKIGLIEVNQAGVTSGELSFKKLFLEVTVCRRNDQELAAIAAIRVIEITTDQATFEFPADWNVEKDKFTLSVEFRLGDAEKIFEIEWMSETAQCIKGAGCLAQGKFIGGQLLELAQILQLIDQRQVELRNFFVVAKGA